MDPRLRPEKPLVLSFWGEGFSCPVLVVRLSIVRHGRGSAVVARVIEGLPGACARIQVRELQEGSRGTVESRHACCALQRRGCSAWLTCLVEAMGLLCVPELSWVSLERDVEANLRRLLGSSAPGASFP